MATGSRRWDRASKVEVDTRVDRAEELLCIGLGSGKVQSTLAREFGVNPRQARRYIGKVYQRWRLQSQIDAPFQRERLRRILERTHIKCMSEKQWAAAVACLGHLTRLAASVPQHDPRRAARLAAIGPPPPDARQSLIYARRLLLLELYDIVANESLDPAHRLRFMAELTGKLGMLFSRSEIEEQVAEINKLLEGPRSLPHVAEVVDAKSVGWADAARSSREDRPPADPVPPRDPDGDLDPSE